MLDECLRTPAEQPQTVPVEAGGLDPALVVAGRLEETDDGEGLVGGLLNLAEAPVCPCHVRDRPCLLGCVTGAAGVLQGLFPLFEGLSVVVPAGAECPGVVVEVGGSMTSALGLLPYGRGATVRHTVGSRSGGGYEWVNASSAAPRGNTALSLDAAGLITRLTTVWDSSLWSVDAIGRAQAAGILR
ncbi:hypothetical protein [Streptomyces canarius]|uniref:Uncharacterized protein n=1 Tax=Streptomyces canarius TaxID=285453 RepID=A0ABQ3D9B4_9ACTN|nr:hypothetical protein GCM10010345_85050 [Streptomyces canarius]